MATYSDDVEQVRRATDIVDLIESFVPLRRSGTGYSALCPFHEEKTPSFHIWTDSQRFKCFGCQTTGDCFTFIEKKQGLSFRESLEFLAERAGIVLSRRSRDGELSTPRKSIYDCLETACQFFESLLLRSPQVCESLDARGIRADLRKHWRIGLAPDSWQTLHEKLNQSGCPVDVQTAAGLVARSDQGRIYDRFRNRVTFPICDVTGRVVGFGARLLAGVEEGAQNGPKYLNSPENEIFKKGTILYGLDKIARAPRTAPAAANTEPIVVMEGYTDVMLSHGAGLTRAVATLGTALGREHAKLIKRFAADVLLLYDGDEAGLRASERGVGILLEEGLRVRVCVLPDDLDPADYVLEKGSASFMERVGGGVDIIEFMSRRILDRLGNSGRMQDKLQACEELLQLIVRMESVTLQSVCVRKLAFDFGLLESVLNERLRSLIARSDEQKLQKARSQPVATIESADASQVCDDRDRQAASELLGALMCDPSLLSLIRQAGLSSDTLALAEHRAVLDAAFVCAAAGEEPDPTNLAGRLLDTPWRETPLQLWAIFKSRGEALAPDLIVEKAIAYFIKKSTQSAVSELKKALRDAEAVGSIDDAKRVQIEILKLQRTLRYRPLPAPAEVHINRSAAAPLEFEGGESS
ncbi:MAG: DNA primase [Planctomycetes bacterium]|nr:DNA primase [Planctomycetota bacterium]